MTFISRQGQLQVLSVNIERIVMLLPLFFPVLLFAQGDFTPPDKDRKGDYFEGKRNYFNANSGRLKLKSFIMRNDDPSVKKKKFELYFFIPKEFSNQELDIFFEDAHDDYYMMPVKKNWSSGNQSFSWSRSEISGNLESNQLRGCIRVPQHRAQDYLIPVSFSNSSKTSYLEWIFKADQVVTLEYSFRDSSGKELKGDFIEDFPAKEELLIEWRNVSHLPVGYYSLRIKYFLTSGKVVKGEDSYKFYLGQK